MTKKKKTKKELIEENEWLMSLPWIPRMILGLLRYNLFELVLVLMLIFAGLWLLTSFGYIGKHVQIKPGVNIEYKRGSE